MKNRLLLAFFVIVSIPFSVSATDEEVKRGTIVILGNEQRLRFISRGDGETYISWTDLNNALEGWFRVNDKGQVELSPTIQMALLLAQRSDARQQTPTPTTGNVIESRIAGEFTGWSGETVFVLQNGQIWQQDEFAYTYTYRLSPRVTIVNTARGWVMTVDGVSRSIRVKRIK